MCYRLPMITKILEQIRDLLNERFGQIERLIVLSAAFLAAFPLYQWYAEADSRAIDRRVNLVSAMATCGSGIAYTRKSVLIEAEKRQVRDLASRYRKTTDSKFYTDLVSRAQADIFIQEILSGESMGKRTPVGVIAAEYLCAELEANILADPSFQDFLRQEINGVRHMVDEQGDILQMDIGEERYVLPADVVLRRLDSIERMALPKER